MYLQIMASFSVGLWRMWLVDQVSVALSLLSVMEGKLVAIKVCATKRVLTNNVRADIFGYQTQMLDKSSISLL